MKKSAGCATVGQHFVLWGLSWSTFLKLEPMNLLLIQDIQLGKAKWSTYLQNSIFLALRKGLGQVWGKGYGILYIASIRYCWQLISHTHTNKERIRMTWGSASYNCIKSDGLEFEFFFASIPINYPILNITITTTETKAKLKQQWCDFLMLRVEMQATSVTMSRNKELSLE